MFYYAFHQGEFNVFLLLIFLLNRKVQGKGILQQGSSQDIVVSFIIDRCWFHATWTVFANHRFYWKFINYNIYEEYEQWDFYERFSKTSFSARMFLFQPSSSSCSGLSSDQQWSTNMCTKFEQKILLEILSTLKLLISSKYWSDELNFLMCLCIQHWC